MNITNETAGDRMTMYFNAYWLSVAHEQGYNHPAGIPAGSVFDAYKAAHAQLCADISSGSCKGASK